MPVDVFVNKDLGVIEVRSYGVVTREDLFSALESTKVLINKINNNKVLVDTSEEKELPNILDLDDFGSSIPKYMKMAIVVTDEQPTAMRSRFIGNIASIKGAKTNTFTSREDALEWLNSQD
jgi:type II secretory pathway component PulC